MTTYRAAYTEALPFTTPAQAKLSDAALIEAAVAEARTAGAIGTDGGWATEEDFRAALHIGDWSEGSDDDVPEEPVAAGFVMVQEGYAIYGVGKTEAEAREDAVEWVVTDSDGEPSFGDIVCRRASQALIDLVQAKGAPDNWGEVDGVLCTEEQEEAYTD